MKLFIDYFWNVQFLFNNKTGEWFVAFHVKTGHQIIDGFVIYNLLLIIQFNNFLLNLEEEEIDQSNPPFFAFNLFSNDILTLKSSKRFSTNRVYFNRSKMRYRRTNLWQILSAYVFAIFTQSSKDDGRLVNSNEKRDRARNVSVTSVLHVRTSPCVVSTKSLLLH